MPVRLDPSTSGLPYLGSLVRHYDWCEELVTEVKQEVDQERQARGLEAHTWPVKTKTPKKAK